MSLLEVAVALVIVGLMSWGAFTAYETVVAQQEIERGRAQLAQIQSSVRAFALGHGRLPCPASDARGYENLSADGVCVAGAQRGFFPYVSLGLSLPTEAHLAHYAVFRFPDPLAAQDADLAVSNERTGDLVGDAHYLGVTDLIAALNTASAVPLTAARPYVTGDDGASGAIDCVNNKVMATAYWIVLPMQDRDDDGRRLDPPHADAGMCATGSSAPVRFVSDDLVAAESPAQLAGWLRQTLP